MRCQKIKSTNQHTCCQWRDSKFGPEAVLVNYLYKLIITAKVVFYMINKKQLCRSQVWFWCPFSKPITD